MSSSKQTMYIVAAASLALMFVFLGLFVKEKTDAFLVIGVLAMIVSYHIIVRLVIEMACEAAMKNGVDPSAEWYETSDAEQSFYKAVGMRRIKSRLPKLDETDFTLRKQSVEDIIDATCRVEVRHEVNMIASFLVMFATIFFGNVWLYLLTSLAAALFDFSFVAVQRYNRPRLVRVAKKQRQRFFEKLKDEQAPEGSEESTEKPAEQASEESEEESPEESEEPTEQSPEETSEDV
ncbi:MAG: hypothetical protein J1F09_01505 [Oscillospiraceae bacterium]|nr:hypothetical protein [Oscillospiraceae bacterium]